MKKLVTYQKERGNISTMGYRDDSPYRNKSSINIETPSGLIDMSNTGIPLLAKDNTGMIKYLRPYSGQHQFRGNEVMEKPMLQQAGSFIGPPDYLANEINPQLFSEIFKSAQSKESNAVNMPANMLLKQGEDPNALKARLDNMRKKQPLPSPKINATGPLVAANVGLRALSSSIEKDRQDEYRRNQFANDFNQTYQYAENDYGASDYRYLGYQKGGYFARGGEVSKLWKQKTGLDWSKAKEQGLTDGSYDQNISLLSKLKKRDFSLNNNSIQRVASTPTITQSTASPINNIVSSQGNIQPFYKDSEDKKQYQKRLQDFYENVNDYDPKSFFAKSRTNISGVTNESNTCIDGVCGIMERNGKVFNKPTMDNHYIGNGTFYENAYVKKLEDVYQAKGNFQIGDIIQGITPENAVPWDSKVIVSIDPETGEYITYGGTGPTIGRGTRYTEESLKDHIAKKERIVTRPGALLDKNALEEGRIKNPKAIEALAERRDNANYEISTPTPYLWSIMDGAKDYNPKTKEVMDKFITKANDGEFFNDLVKKTNRSKEEINDSLLNVFGILGQENNWGSTGKGLKSRLENIGEKLATNLGVPRGRTLSVGPGQIKFNAIPADLRKEFGIKKAKDLYDIDKVIPLMVAMDLKDRKSLENWGERGELASKLIGKNEPLLAQDLKYGVGRWTPYLRNQYSSIANNKVDAEGKIMPYRLDKGSYPMKVWEKWRDNIQRKTLRPSILYPDQNIQEKDDYYNTTLPEVSVYAKRKKQLGGYIDPNCTECQKKQTGGLYNINKTAYVDSTKKYSTLPNTNQAKWFAENGYKQGTNVLKNKFQDGGEIPDQEFDMLDFLYSDETAKVQEVDPEIDRQNKKNLKKQQDLIAESEQNSLAMELASDNSGNERRSQSSGDESYGASSVPIQTSADVMSKAIEGKKYLMSQHGLSNELASGLLGNAFAESGLNSRVTNSIGAFGTFQHLKTRKRDLFEYAKKRNQDPGDFKTQLDFAVHELNTSHRGANRNYGSAREAAIGIMNKFEIPSESEKRSSVNKRVSFAEKMLDYQSGGEYDVDPNDLAELTRKGYKFNII